MAATKTGTAKKKAPTKDPKGGLTAAGRAEFKKKTGAILKPGVKGTPKTPEEMKRKGPFLRRHFANLRGPLQDENGEPTRLALQAQAWGEKVPKTEADAKKLADKGAKLLEQYHAAQEKDGGAAKKPAAKKAPAKKKSEAKS
jgi:hypothetical protein